MDITPGLVCDNGELFSKNGENYAVISGSCIPYEQFPPILLEAIDASITPTDHACLINMGKYSLDERRNQWLQCNVSGFDHLPDYIYGQLILQREFVQCPNRGNCKAEGKLCRTLPQLTGLTPTQIIVLQDVYEGLLNKEIADKRGMKPETVASHTQNIRIKKGLARKADLVRYAQTLNLKSQNNEQKNNSSKISR